MNILEEKELEYRKEKYVEEMKYFTAINTGWCVCPTCQKFLDREYLRYCSSCGQKLKWNMRVIVVTKI